MVVAVAVAITEIKMVLAEMKEATLEKMADDENEKNTEIRG
jgi:hypothetical protein